MGALFLAILARFREAEFKRARAEGRRESFEAMDADALIAMARAADGQTDGSTGDASPKRPSSRTEYHVNVRVDFDALVRGHAHQGETCEIGGVTVPVSVVRDILDNAFLVALLTRGTEVMKVRRFGRHVPAAVRDALRFRDGATCTVEGCSRDARLQMDHIQPVSRDGPTAMDNLELLCRDHHKEKTARDRLFEDTG
jgi:hypothetical protein